MVSDPKQLDAARQLQYERLAKRIAGILSENIGALVEIGCGRGQLTIPLAKLVPNRKVILVDRFLGPYRRDYRLLVAALSRERLRQRVQVIVGDYAEWLSAQSNREYDAILSSEFLCEIDSNQMSRLFSECYRILKPGGITLHSFLSPVAKTSGQLLLIEADSNPKWTKFPPEERFSPRPGAVAARLKKAGFGTIRVVGVKSNLIIKAEAAQSLLKQWGVKTAFWQSYRKRLLSRGLEIPDWEIVSGVRLS